MTPREELAHELKIQFRLPPDRPTSAELSAILVDVAEESRTLGRRLTKGEWHDIVFRHVHFEGHWLYEGLDFQDLKACAQHVEPRRAPATGSLQRGPPPPRQAP